MTPKTRARITPTRVFIAIGVLLAVLLIFTPITDFRTDDRLSTFNSDAPGARGTYEVIRHLGFSTIRTKDRFADTISARPIYVILNPKIPLSEAERHTLQDAVRRGAGLFLATQDDSLAAVFGFTLTKVTSFIEPIAHFTVTHDPVPWDMDAVMENVANNSIYAAMAQSPSTIALKSGVTSPTDMFLEYDSTGRRNLTIDAPNHPWLIHEPPSSHLPAMLGTTFGNGQVVLLATPSLLTNQTARGVPPVVATVDALEWMRGKQRLIVFDEYHQGYGLHADIMEALWTVLSTTRPGWALSQGIIAALLLLAAIGLRPIPPVPQHRTQRRSPLEHVIALASAYKQTEARAFGVEQLVRGLRRRHPLGVNRNASPETYFAIVRSNFPKTQEAAESLLAMLHGTIPARLADAATLVAAIEQEFPGKGGTTYINRSSQFV